MQGAHSSSDGLTNPVHRITACLRFRVNLKGLGWGGKR